MTMDAGSAGIGETGFTLDDLSDYLDRGRTPAIAAIDNSPECQAMLASMERMGSLTRDLVAQDQREHPMLEEGWLGGLLESISREVRAGRDIPLTAPDPRASLSVTEGAIRELIRSAGDSVDGVLVGSCTLEGDVDVVGGLVTVDLAISVVLQTPVLELAEQVRQRVYTRLLAHTELSIGTIDVTVSDVHIVTRPAADGDAS
ncbi:putative alkaline shock family protein YloU [Salinibacterium sp. CAN_S4]|uniref:Asp23/Gls24 family envelope stress response protein n=1 Tax=Salinibacterium sp. CAN_S4 TaxID=2787727 RepID=UPI0018EFD2A2